MSDSPIRRFSTASPTNHLKREESLINAYEAEEERIINVLSRKLEQLREEKIQLENALEAENESHVNRLNRELSALRAQAQASVSAGGAQGNGSTGASGASSPVVPRSAPFLNNRDPTAPSVEVMLEAMRRENEQLRTRLVDTERDYVRISRLNDIYREELLELRRRLGLSVDNLVGLTPSDPFSQPTHRRSLSSGISSPSTSVVYPSARHAMPIPTHAHGVPIPRPSSSIHRPTNVSSETTTPLSYSPSSTESPSPFVFSPVLSSASSSVQPAAVGSLMSNGTQMTTPSTSGGGGGMGTAHVGGGGHGHGLSYPSVPPPSLSSSYGSPVVSYLPRGESPAEGLSRRGSGAHGRGAGVEVGGSGTGVWRARSGSRRESVERGGRIAETGSLVRSRSRADSQSVLSSTRPEAVSESDGNENGE